MPTFVMPISRNARKLTVSLVVVPESSAAVIYGLHEVFTCVGTVWETLTGEKTSSRQMQPRIVGSRIGAVRTKMGATVYVDHEYGEKQNSDVVIVSDLALEPGFQARVQWTETTGWIKAQYDRGALICSVCTGSLLLAEAGLLKQREATSHWSAAQFFKESYPEVDLQLRRMLVPAGPAHNIVTSGGSSSWADLALYVIARFCGEAEARRIAKVFLFGDHSEGQLPFAAMVRPKQHADAAIADCQTWIATNYERLNPVTEMTKRSGLTERTFKRRFAAATGYSPLDYVQSLRIEEAKQMLETSDDPIDEIGMAVGYEDSNSFRRLFKRNVGTTPQSYRRRYQKILSP